MVEAPSVHFALPGRKTLLVAALILAAAPAWGHINVLRGRLVDLVKQSDVVIIGVVTVPASASTSGKDLEIDVVGTIRGTIDGKSLTARTSARLMQGERQVIFLAREGDGFRCVHGSGTRFPATADDDADYRRAVEGIAAALHLPEDEQIRALRAALIPALRAKSLPLRYHAGLELTALDHDGHPLTAAERAAIERIRAEPDFDATLSPIVDGLLRTAPQSSP